MEFRQLQYFMEIARLGGFRRAASELGLSQATLSEKIKQLEEDLHVRLFERSNRQLSLTVAGTALLQRADRILIEMKAAREEMLEYTDLERGYLAVGVLAPSGALPWIPALLAAFKSSYPDVQLTLFERTNEQLVDLVRDAELHAAWMLVPSDSGTDTGGVVIHPLYSRELVLIVPSGHRFAGRESVTIDELSGEPLLLPRPGEPTRTVVDRAFQIHGVEPTIGCEVTDPMTLTGLAAAGLGIAISAQAVARRFGSQVCTLRIEGLTMTYSVALAWAERGARTRAVVTFVDFAETWMQDWLAESARGDDPATPHPRSGITLSEGATPAPIAAA